MARGLQRSRVRQTFYKDKTDMTDYRIAPQWPVDPNAPITGELDQSAYIYDDDKMYTYKGYVFAIAIDGKHYYCRARNTFEDWQPTTQYWYEQAKYYGTKVCQ